MGAEEWFSFIMVTVWEPLRGNLLLAPFCRESMNCIMILTLAPNTAVLPVLLSLCSVVQHAHSMSEAALNSFLCGVRPCCSSEDKSVILSLCVVLHNRPCYLLIVRNVTFWYFLLCMNFCLLLLFDNASKTHKL